MVVDSSAIMAIVFRESGWEFLSTKLAMSPQNQMSAASKVECGITAYRRQRAIGAAEFRLTLRRYDIGVVPVDEQQADLAIQTFEIYGKGIHPAGLNFGDCIVYALAKSLNEPLLFKGNDFSQTDITPA